MHVGVDLAWSTRARTGLAAVDAAGAVVASTSVRDDDEIDVWLADLPEPVVNVAIDAPLIVTNATGMRECEKLVGRAYGRYDASCHPSNRGRSYFDPPRAETLAKRHGWQTDPHHVASAAVPGAIEVYPHAAMVGLFRLGRTLKYKNGLIAPRRLALLELLNHVEGIDSLALAAYPRWRQLREIVEAATRPFMLDQVEDEIDAIVCAHLAWLWHIEPSQLQVYGDGVDGYIVAPPPPTDPVTPRLVVAS